MVRKTLVREFSHDVDGSLREDVVDQVAECILMAVYKNPAKYSEGNFMPLCRAATRRKAIRAPRKIALHADRVRLWRERP
jgi:hypothetical protein